MEGFKLELYSTDKDMLSESLGISVERHEEMGEKLVELSKNAQIIGRDVAWVMQQLMDECENANEVVWFSHTSFAYFNSERLV